MVYVGCGGCVRPFKSMKDVVTTFKEYTYYCEGSERERYMSIVMEALDNIGKQEACISDGMRVFEIGFELSKLNPDQLATIRKGFGITVEELTKMAVKYKERVSK